MINKNLLLEIKQHLLAEPGRLVMAEGLQFGKPGEERELIGSYQTKERDTFIFPECGTVGCIAGWACVLGDKNFRDTKWIAVEAKAVELLGVDFEDRNSIFRVSSWPHDLQAKYLKARQARSRVKIVAERIDRVIADAEKVAGQGPV